MIKVVCGIILTQNKILVTQRSEKMSHPLQWEFPGGKIYQDESEMEGLKRELFEELNIDVEPVSRLASVMHTYSDKMIELIPYICVKMKGNLQLKEHASVQLVNLENLDDLDWVEADIKIVDYLMSNKSEIMEMMKNNKVKDTTLVLGASPKEDRYSNMAVKKLKKYHHDVIAIGNKEGFIDDTPIQKELTVFDNIHTVTMYIGTKNQDEYYDYILALQPERVIFNPGTENPELYKLLKQNNIEFLEACTLVMLGTGQY